MRQVFPSPILEFFDYCSNTFTGIKHIIDDQQTIFVVDFINEVPQPMDLHLIRCFFNARVIGRADGNVICFDAGVIE